MTVHNDEDFPVNIGDYVTIGHNSIIHGCKISSNTLIGMGSTILNGAEIGEYTIIGAGSLVTQGKENTFWCSLYGSTCKGHSRTNYRRKRKYKKICGALCRAFNEIYYKIKMLKIIFMGTVNNYLYNKLLTALYF